jgi:hypothetical protein
MESVTPRSGDISGGLVLSLRPLPVASGTAQKVQVAHQLRIFSALFCPGPGLHSVLTFPGFGTFQCFLFSQLPKKSHFLSHKNDLFPGNPNQPQYLWLHPT